MRKWRSRSTLWGLVIVALALLGIVSEQVGRYRDRSRYPQVGSSFDIGSRSLNVYCLGEGSPTVVFDTFSHLAGYNWIAVQPEVAKFTRACWYDRAGYGWSDPGPLYPTANHVASDLHALLKAAIVPPPYVFVGQGDVTLQVRAFNKQFPKEIAGAVIISGNDVFARPAPPISHRSGLERVFGSWAAPGLISAACTAVPAIARVGLTRLSRPRRTWSYGLTRELQSQADFLSDNPTAYRHTATGLCVQERSRNEARAAGNLGDIPLRVLVSSQRSGGRQESSTQDMPSAEARLEHELRIYQPRLVALSTRGRLVIIDQDVSAADVITNIRDVVSQVRTAK